MRVWQKTMLRAGRDDLQGDVFAEQAPPQPVAQGEQLSRETTKQDQWALGWSNVLLRAPPARARRATISLARRCASATTRSSSDFSPINA